MVSEQTPPRILDLLNLLAQRGFKASRVDRRPSATKGPFHDAYFVEIESNNKDWNSLYQQLNAVIKQLKGEGTEPRLIGMWSFNELTNP
jgi:prephenate dehydratase